MSTCLNRSPHLSRKCTGTGPVACGEPTATPGVLLLLNGVPKARPGAHMAASMERGSALKVDFVVVKCTPPTLSCTTSLPASHAAPGEAEGDARHVKASRSRDIARAEGRGKRRERVVSSEARLVRRRERVERGVAVAHDLCSQGRKGLFFLPAKSVDAPHRGCTCEVGGSCSVDRSAACSLRE